MSLIITIGLAIILIAVVLIMYDLFIGSGQVYNSAANLTSNINATIKPNSTYTMAFNYSNSTGLFFLARSTDRINFYLMNSSAYGLFESSNSPSMYAEAVSLEGKGTLFVYRNATNSSFPISYRSGLEYEYTKNQSQPPRDGIYYLVADNTNGSAASANEVSIGIVYLQNFYRNQSDAAKYQKFAGALNSERLVGETGGLAIIFGIAVVVYGFIRRRKNSTDESPVKNGMSEEEIDKLYENERVGTKLNSGSTKGKKRTVKKGAAGNIRRKKRVKKR